MLIQTSSGGDEVFETGGTAARIPREEFIPLPAPARKLGSSTKLEGLKAVWRVPGAEEAVSSSHNSREISTYCVCQHRDLGSQRHRDNIFVGADCNTSDPDVRKLPIVKLPGIPDNVYPPQKKVFAVLHYIHDHYLGEFQWL